jgi:D-tyrosyl-tRNA(Tyr) deacylase
MRVVIQRVKQASVSVAAEIRGSIGNGMVVLAGFEGEDNDEDALWVAKKIAALRIFNDNKGLMNHSVTDINGNVLVVSQFTLHAMTKKGNRPSFLKAAKPEKAIHLYNFLINELEILTKTRVQQGVFGAMMEVSLVNDGPVTIIIDSKMKE